MTTAENEEAADPQAANQAAAERDRSATRYPYYDLEEAEKFARAVRETGGNEVREDDLLKHLGISRTTKSWIYRLSTAREFGLIERKGQKDDARIALTDLGRRLLKPAHDAEQAASRIAAFLSPAIYKKLFKHYEGGPRPQVKFLGNFLNRQPYGLLESVAEQAATAFLASAVYAGLLDGDMFVTLGPGDAKPAEQAPLPPPPPAPPPGGTTDLPLDPKGFIRHTFLIRKGQMEIILLAPRDLSSRDVKRIVKWLPTLAIDDDDDDGDDDTPIRKETPA